jgi:hypothetical protein
MPIDVGDQQPRFGDLQIYRHRIGERRRRVVCGIRHHDVAVWPDRQEMRRVCRLARPADADTDAGRGVRDRTRVPELPDEARRRLGQHVAGGRQLRVVALRPVVRAKYAPHQGVLAEAQCGIIVGAEVQRLRDFLQHLAFAAAADFGQHLRHHRPAEMRVVGAGQHLRHQGTHLGVAGDGGFEGRSQILPVQRAFGVLLAPLLHALEGVLHAYDVARDEGREVDAMVDDPIEN